MNLIVAVDMENGIGLHGELLYRIPEDQKYFKRMTMGKAIVMGHSTLKALPGAAPLKGRKNIVLTRSADMMIEGCTVCHDLHEVFEAIAPYESNDVFVIGGENVYTQFLPYCSLAYITRIQSAAPADRFFPILENDAHWALISESEQKEYDGLRYTFQVYQNLAVKDFF